MLKKTLSFIFLLFACAFSTSLAQSVNVAQVKSIDSTANKKRSLVLKYTILDTIVLNHSHNANIKIDDFIKHEFILLFDNPVLATFFFQKDTLKKHINYNMIHQRIVVKKSDNQYLKIEYNPPPDSIDINGKIFVITSKGAILERIRPSRTNFFIGYKSKSNYSKLTGLSSLQEINKNYPTGSFSVILKGESNEEINAIITSEAKPILYYFNGKRHVIIKDKKKFLSVLNERNKKYASKYMESKDISFNNVDDLYSLIGHLFGEYNIPSVENSVVETKLVEEVKPIIPKEIELSVAITDSLLKHELNKYMSTMLTNNQISENVETTVVANVVQEKNEFGEDELNLQIEYGYRVIKASFENKTDDYPSGKYRLVNSNAAKITCQILKQTFENELEEFLLPDTRVSIRITGSTDGTPITGTIPYDDAFGKFEKINYFVNNSLDNVTITKETGITTNQQLAFLRTYGVRQFIDTFVEPLKFTKNSFSHYSVVHKELGAEYRRITVKFTIHNAFDNQKPSTPKYLGKESIISASDVDINIPKTTLKYPKKFALIIGNEDYSSRQKGLAAESNVAFASRDAEIFRKYCVETLGLEEKNVFLITNATSAEMNQKIDLVSQIVQKSGDISDLLFYYAGHGLPDEITREPYLIPVDVSASYLPAAIKLSDVYKKLSKSGAKRVTVFLDACFSGGGREAGLLAARAVRVRPKEEVISGNLVVFSATSNDQSALPFKEKKHGMFTYFLLKKLQETGGVIDYGNLDEYIFKNVSVESLRVNSKAQDPKTSFSYSAQDIWKSWSLK